MNNLALPPKAASSDFLGRFREVISDPLNLLIERVPLAGIVEANDVYLHNGNKVPLSGSGAYYDSFSQILVVNRGVHEPLEEFVFQEVLRRLPATPLMIELGAYWAHYSMWLLKRRPPAAAVMVEPDPGNLAAGRSNFARNNCVGEFIQAAVAKGHWQLDPFLQARGIAHVDIVHVDIQGYELEFIDGARNALGGKKIDRLFISTHSQELHRRVTGELAGLGYRIEVSSDFENETTSHDGLVFASSPQIEPTFKSLKTLGRVELARSGPSDLLETLAGVRSALT